MEIESILREKTGRGDARKLRRNGYVPAILYGEGENKNIAVEQRAIKIKMKDEAFYSSVLTIHCGKKKVKALLREVQMHPYRSDIMHMDFQSVRDDTEISTSVPIHYINVDICPGVKLHQGIFSTVENQIGIHCLPKDLPESITVDVQSLEIGKSIHLSEVVTPDGVRFDAIGRGEDPVLAVVSEVKDIVEPDPAAPEVTPETDSTE